MKILSLPLIASGLIGISLVAISSFAHGTKKETPVSWPETRDYKKWTLVTPRPLLLPAPLDAMCMQPPPGRYLLKSSYNPHRKRYFMVYVNDIGKAAMLHQANPDFPRGTIIVKEKRVKPNNPSPELMTVMVKHAKGFAPEAGDWEYVVLNGKGQKISPDAVKRPGFIDAPNITCQSCHAKNAEKGYVFRSYLPESIRKQLH